jgi:predicted permease
MQVILNSLIPIFAVIGLGIVLRRRNFLDESATQAFNRFAYYFALPSFLFYKLGSVVAAGGLANRYTFILLASTVVAMLCGWLVAMLAGIKFAGRGAFVQASLRGNLAFMGLPLVAFLICDLDVAQREAIESAMLLSLAPVVIFFNVASVAMLAIYNENTESHFSWAAVARNIATNPILLACLAGLLVQKTEWQIPVAIDRICQIIGTSAFPLALIGIGSQLATISINGRLRLPMISTAIKCVVCPAACWAIATLVGLAGAERQVLVILAAMPTAVSSYVLAEQMNSDADLAASSVVVSTAASMLTLTVLLLLL